MDTSRGKKTAEDTNRVKESKNSADARIFDLGSKNTREIFRECARIAEGKESSGSGGKEGHSLPTRDLSTREEKEKRRRQARRVIAEMKGKRGSCRKRGGESFIQGLV